MCILHFTLYSVPPYHNITYHRSTTSFFFLPARPTGMTYALRRSVTYLIRHRLLVLTYVGRRLYSRNVRSHPLSPLRTFITSSRLLSLLCKLLLRALCLLPRQATCTLVAFPTRSEGDARACRLASSQGSIRTFEVTIGRQWSFMIFYIK